MISGYRDIGILGCQDVSLPVYRDIGKEGYREIGISGYRYIEISGYQNIRGRALNKNIYKIMVLQKKLKINRFKVQVLSFKREEVLENQN